MTSRYLVPLLCLMSLSAQTGPTLSNTVASYCSGCHNGTMRSPSGVRLDQFDAGYVAEFREVWSRAYRQLQAGTMPPVGAPRPDRAAVVSALAEIESALRAGATAPASGPEIATRLARLVWNSAPDEALLKDAARMQDPAVLERHVRRMLADGRAQAFVDQFFVPWLQLDHLAKANPNPKLFPDFDPALPGDAAKETGLFLLSQLREDRDPLDLWTANYTYLNERLAKHYGIGDVKGAEFRRVNLKSPERAGLLGQGSILMLTSRLQPDGDAYTSPANRGKWVRTHFLGVQPPNPFPGAQPVKPELPITPQTRLLPNDPCVTCHRNFFPLGYALENFDPLGRWRTHDQAGPVDASGAAVNGTAFNGVIEMRRTLLDHPDAFRTAITERLLGYVETGKVAQTGSPDTLIRARAILSGMKQPRWSALIAAAVR